jgi:L-fuconolactonase
MIVDAHHHLFDPERHEYPWMTDGPLARRYDLDELRAAAPRVEASVLVEGARTEAECSDMLRIAEESGGFIRFVVGWADLTAPDLGERIAALRAAPGGERLRGLRHNVEDEQEPEWLLRADVQRGLRAVSDAGLTYDILVKAHQLPAARQAVEQQSELRFVLDHGGKPDIAHDAWEPWDREIGRLAALPNVWCKLSGLVTEASPDRWREQGVDRYARRLLERFGPGRLMFGSDWPVCTLAASYAEVLDVAESVVAELSAADQDAIWGATALAFYGGERNGGD